MRRAEYRTKASVSFCGSHNTVFINHTYVTAGSDNIDVFSVSATYSTGVNIFVATQPIFIQILVYFAAFVSDIYQPALTAFARRIHCAVSTCLSIRVGLMAASMLKSIQVAAILTLRWSPTWNGSWSVSSQFEKVALSCFYFLIQLLFNFFNVDTWASTILKWQPMQHHVTLLMYEHRPLSFKSCV